MSVETLSSRLEGMKEKKPLKSSIMSWLKDNLFSPRSLEHDDVEFHIVVQRGHINLNMVRPKGKMMILIYVKFNFLKDDENKDTPNVRKAFMKAVSELYPPPEVDIFYEQHCVFMVQSQIHDDGFTYDRLFEVMRGVSQIGAYLYQLLFEIAGVDSKVFDANPSYYA